MIDLYGIANCDKVRAARRWLETAAMDYDFHDMRQQPPAPEVIRRWYQHWGAELINRRSTTWRNLDARDKSLDSEAAIIELISREPTLIKRPVLEAQDLKLLGFSADSYAKYLTHLKEHP